MKKLEIENRKRRVFNAITKLTPLRSSKIVKTNETSIEGTNWKRDDLPKESLQNTSPSSPSSPNSCECDFHTLCIVFFSHVRFTFIWKCAGMATKFLALESMPKFSKLLSKSLYSSSFLPLAKDLWRVKSFTYLLFPNILGSQLVKMSAYKFGECTRNSMLQICQGWMVLSIQHCTFTGDQMMERGPKDTENIGFKGLFFSLINQCLPTLLILINSY